MNNMSSILSFFTAVISVFLWSASPVISKIVLQSMDAITFMLYRYMFGTIIGLFWLPQIIKSVVKIPTYNLTKFFLYSTSHIIFQVLALNIINASWYVVFFSFSPVLTIFLKESVIDKTLIITVLICIISTIYFVDFKLLKNEQNLYALLYLTISLIGWVLLSIEILSFQKYVTDIQIAFLINFEMFFIALCFVLFTENNIAIIFYNLFNRGNREIFFIILTLNIMLIVAFSLFSFAMRVNSKVAI